MNCAYRVVWNVARNSWIVASELTKGRTKSSRRSRSAAIGAVVLGISAGNAIAGDLPTGGSITSGTGNIASNGSSMTVNQGSSQLNIDWQSFSIGQGHSVTFVQPSSSSIAFNRVTGSDVSSIQGALTANGLVFLSNPNGILFTPTAQVNVGGLVATTLGVSGQDGQYQLQGTSNAAVTQQGHISTTGGTVALVAAHVVNSGEINAPGGSVLLGAGKTVTLDFGGPVKIRVDDGALDALVEQGGVIRADGGLIYMTAKAADALSTAVINHTGISQARSLSTNERGEIVLLGDMQHGTVNVGGTLDASAPHTGDGGAIETSAATVKIADDAHITTAAAQGHSGTWLIDPNDFSIGGSNSNLSGATLTSILATSDVHIRTATAGNSGGNGDIFVNDLVSWSANTLTLEAERNIEVNATLSASNTAGLALEYGLGAPAAGNTATYSLHAPINLASTASFSTRLGSDGATLGYTIITSLGAAGSTTGTDLQGIDGDRTGRYVLGADIDASATSAWNAGAGFSPIGQSSTFDGVLDGLGHSISNLQINTPSTDSVGLFASISGSAAVRNIGLAGGSIAGKDNVGALVGQNNGAIGNANSTAFVSGAGTVGGLIGINNGTIDGSFASAIVQATGFVGGLVGANVGTINTSYANGSVTGTAFVGGLAGGNPGSIVNSYSTAQVSGSNFVGGLVGDSGGSVAGSFATGAVSGDLFVGGLVGYNDTSSSITNAYATGSVAGITGDFGGLVGHNKGLVLNVYSTGAVSAGGGGLIGSNEPGGAVINGFWATDTSGQISSAGGIGETFSDLLQLNTFANAGWDIDDQGGTGSAWRIYDGATTPMLRSFLTPLTVTANDVDKGYDRVAFNGGNGISFSTTPFFGLQGSLQFGGTAQGAINAGSYSIGVSGLSSNSNVHGYDITFADGTLTIHQAQLVLNAQTDTRTYDGTILSSQSVQVNGLVAGDTINNLSQSFNSRNAGSRTLIINPGYFVNDGNGGNNYAVTTHAALGTINQATLTLNAVTDSRTYNGTTASSGVAQASGLGAGDTVTGLTQSFDSRNAGTRTLSVDAGYTVNDGNGGNNYVVATNTAAGNIAQAALALNAVNDTRTYDGTTASSGAVQSSGLVSGDTVTGLVQSFDSRNAGARTLSVNNGYTVNDGNSGNNYIVTTNTAAGNIGQATLTLNAVTDTRTYDGTAASSGAVQSSGLVTGDTVTGLTQSFDSRNAGNRTLGVDSGYTVNDGNGGNNYTVTTNTAAGSIAQAALALNAVTDSRTYNGTTASSGAVQSSGLVTGDSVTGLTQSFDSRNAGTRTLSVDAGYVVNDGNGGNNYVIAANTASGNIAQAALALNAVTDTRTYDGTTASGGTVQSNGLVSGDTVTGLTQSFDSRNAGTRTLSVDNGYTVNDGNGGNNYTITTNTAAGNIGQASLALNAVTDSRTYNGTTASSGAVQSSGLVSGDTVTGLTQSFDSRNSGARTLSVDGGYVVNDGNGGNNYAVTTNTAAGNIAQAALALNAVTDSRTYDGTTNSNGAAQSSGLVSGDTVTGLTQSFDSRNAGARTLSINGGYTVNDGNGGNNYTITTNTASGNIAQATLALNAVTDSRTYDGTTNSNGAVQSSGLATGDTVTGLTQSFDSRNAGARTLGVNNGYVVNDGNGGNNYVVSTNTAAGNIAQATLDLTAATDSRTYDGTTASSGAVLSSGLVSGDTVTGLTQSFDSRNAGARTLGVNNGYTVNDGNGGNNYAVATHTANGNIAQAALTLNAVTDSRTYNGTTASNGAVQSSGLVTGDTLTGLTQSFDSRNAGARTLSVNNGYVVNDGNGGNNYAVTANTAAGNIAQAALALNAVTDTRTYNGTTASNGVVQSNGLASGDTVTGLTQSFDSRNAGARTLSIDNGYVVNDGNGGNNYTVTTNTAAGNIGQAALALNAVTDTRTYNGTTASNGAVQSSGLATGDTVTGLTQSFDSRNAGARTLSINNGYVVNDGNGGNNYAVTTNTAAGNIGQAALTLNAATDSRTYNGTTASAGVVQSSGLIAGDTVTGLSQSFDSRNAGARTLNVNGGYTVNDGNGGNNYAVTTNTAAGNIARAALALNAVTDSRTYNGTTASAGVAQSSGLVAGDTVTGLTQSFDSRNAGARTLNVNGGYTVNDGNGGNNYTVTTTGATGNIAQAALTLSAVTDSRVYNGTTSSNGVVQSSGLVGGDTVTGLTQSFDSPLAGNRTLSVNGGYAVNDGNGGNNYAVTTNTANGSISQAAEPVVAAISDAQAQETDEHKGTQPTEAPLLKVKGTGIRLH